MSDIKLLKIFKEEFIKFLDELIEMFPSEQSFIVLKFFVNDQIPIVLIMDHMSKSMLPYEEYIISRNPVFFELSSIFNGFKVDNISDTYFMDLWNSEKVDDEDKEVIWQWIRHFLVMIKKYKSIFLNSKK